MAYEYDVDVDDFFCGGKTQIRLKNQYHIGGPTRTVCCTIHLGSAARSWARLEIGTTLYAKHPFG